LNIEIERCGKFDHGLKRKDELEVFDDTLSIGDDRSRR